MLYADQRLAAHARNSHATQPALYQVIAHVPILCEEKGMAYVYVPSKEELGAASLTKRPTSIVMVTCKPDSEFKDAYTELEGDLKAVLPKF